MLAKIEGAQLVTKGVITEIERKALLELRDRLQSGDIQPHEPRLLKISDFQPNAPLPKNQTSPRLAFEMNAWLIRNPRCGTIGCIAGLCWEISHGLAFDEIIKSRGDSLGERLQLLSLFLPGAKRDLTPADATHAITTFLATGKADWGYERLSGLA